MPVMQTLPIFSGKLEKIILKISNPLNAFPAKNAIFEIKKTINFSNCQIAGISSVLL